MGLIDALCDVVPAVKPQSAFYERFGFEGVEVLKRTVDYAKSRGLYVIMDAKRGDIGSTAEGYSDAYLGAVKIGNTEVEPFGCDCLTINAYLGSDGINPFIKDCVARDRAVFALVKTSNPSSGELQNIVAGDRKVYNVVGDLLERLGKDTVDKYGYTCVGAVTGATYPDGHPRPAPPPGENLLPGARLRRPGRQGRRRAVCLRRVWPRRYCELLPRHYLRLAEDRRRRP